MPNEIVAALAKQKIRISEGVASNYKSVIKRKLKKKRSTAEAVPVETQAAAVSQATVLDPALVDLLKAAKELDWGQVRSIAELMDEV
jgi:hypothetical protein